jgi:hypothetical protein
MRFGRGVNVCGRTGDIQDSIWEDNKRNGMGIVMFKDSGDFFKGMFAEDKFEGFGTYFDSNKQELYIG